MLTLLVLGSSFVVLSFMGKTEKPNNINKTKVLTTAVRGAETNSAKVKSVIDGDTFELTTGERVRLIGINSPESGQPDYEKAKKSLEDLVLGKYLDMQFDVTKNDQYGRLLAYVYAGDMFVNMEQIKNGFAVVETIPPNVKYTEEFVGAQQKARSKCQGIWEGLCNQTDTSCVQIASINADPKGDDNTVKNSEWVELVNTCSMPKNLSGYLIKDSSASNSYTFKNETLPPKGKLKLHSGCSLDSATDVYWQCPEKKNMIWNNTTDHAFLYDNNGKLVSDISY